MMNASGGKTDVVQNINGSHEDGVLRFDPDNLSLGYRFCPTDTELLVFLTIKIHHQPLPPNNIAQVNLYAHHPEQLAGRYKAQGEKEWYYFTPRERKYTNGQRPKRSIGDGDGYWKATGVEKEIKSWEEGGKITGYKRALVFYQGSHPDGVKTNWIMHEFRVAALPPPTTDHHDILNDNNKRFDDYVLCRVYKNNRSDGGFKRSRDDKPTNIDSNASTSASKIPKLHFNPAKAINPQLTASPGIQHVEEYNNPFVNIPQRLQNQQQQQQQQEQPQPFVQIPEVSSAYISRINNLPVLPPAGHVDAFLHRDSERLWDEPTNDASSSSSKIPKPQLEANDQLTTRGGMEYVEKFTDLYEYNPFVNIPQIFQNQQEQQQLQSIVQMPQVSSACAVFSQNNLPVLPPAGVDVFFHGDSERLWDDQSKNDASSSSSMIPKLKHGLDEAENQLTVSGGVDYVEEYWTGYEYNLFDNIPHRLQNQHEQQQQQPIVPNNNLQDLPYDQNDYPCKYGRQCYWE